MRYFSIVQETAAAQGCVFFLDCGEDHDLITDEIDCQDLSGWLIEEEAADEFERLWLARDWDMMTSDQMDAMVTAIWSGEPGNISVRFEPMP